MLILFRFTGFDKGMNLTEMEHPTDIKECLTHKLKHEKAEAAMGLLFGATTFLLLNEIETIRGSIPFRRIAFSAGMGVAVGGLADNVAHSVKHVLKRRRENSTK